MKKNYYAKKLNAKRLYEVYQTRCPRVKTYLDAEISFVKDQLCGTENVLEIGAGYGRIMKELALHCKSIAGIDISEDNIAF
ncbi:MAG: class I SAM-dependent methyltransferase, partial [Defluviitaleaceae bacterium]|nr:class I SAM-dependent methyltransferase [Defluviitaleaceae bacterium]